MLTYVSDDSDDDSCQGQYSVAGQATTRQHASSAAAAAAAAAAAGNGCGRPPQRKAATAARRAFSPPAQRRTHHHHRATAQQPQQQAAAAAGPGLGPYNAAAGGTGFNPSSNAAAALPAPVGAGAAAGTAGTAAFASALGAGGSLLFGPVALAMLQGPQLNGPAAQALGRASHSLCARTHCPRPTSSSCCSSAGSSGCSNSRVQLLQLRLGLGLGQQQRCLPTLRCLLVSRSRWWGVWAPPRCGWSWTCLPTGTSGGPCSATVSVTLRGGCEMQEVCVSAMQAVQTKHPLGCRLRRR
jgi:hypothetical protein